jgi:hypothetical protein
MSMPSLRLAVLAGGLAAMASGIFGEALAQSTASAPRPLGFVSAVKGAPTIRDATGATKPLRPLQTFTAGNTILLNGADSLDLCHEDAATAFRVEGAGAFSVDASGLIAQAETIRITQRGRCGRSVPPSVPGGVLFRKIEPTK